MNEHGLKGTKPAWKGLKNECIMYRMNPWINIGWKEPSLPGKMFKNSWMPTSCCPSGKIDIIVSELIFIWPLAVDSAWV